MSDEDKVCEHHKGLISMLEKLTVDVSAIKVALLGDYQNKGFITYTNESIAELERRVVVVEKWKEDFLLGVKRLYWKIIGALITAIATGVVVGFFTAKVW